MKKSELKVGEEYAVFLSPGSARRFQNGNSWSRSDQPLRVTLLGVDAVERVWERGSYSGAAGPRDVKGHKVSIPAGTSDRSARSTVTITIYNSSIDAAIADGLKVKPPEDTAFARGTRQADYTRKFLMLENAGCFVSTWAEFEAKKKRQEEANAVHQERKLQERLANDQAAPIIERRLAAVLDKLTEYGEVKLSGSYYGDDDLTRNIAVEGPGFKLSGEKVYRDSEVERYALAGASFKLSLSTLEKLLGIGS